MITLNKSIYKFNRKGKSTLSMKLIMKKVKEYKTKSHISLTKINQSDDQKIK